MVQFHSNGLAVYEESLVAEYTPNLSMKKVIKVTNMTTNFLKLWSRTFLISPQSSQCVPSVHYLLGQIRFRFKSFDMLKNSIIVAISAST